MRVGGVRALEQPTPVDALNPKASRSRSRVRKGRKRSSCGARIMMTDPNPASDVPSEQISTCCPTGRCTRSSSRSAVEPNFAARSMINAAPLSSHARVVPVGAGFQVEILCSEHGYPAATPPVRAGLASE